MKLIEANNYSEMSKIAADYIINKVCSFPNIKLGLATGGTPLGVYAKLISDHRKNKTSYRLVTTFNLDEYVGLSGENPYSYRYYMDHNLFNHIDIQKKNTFLPRGDVGDLQKECELFENFITKHKGIDLQILGIGENGHIGFNEPGTSFESKTHLVHLTTSTRSANTRYFNSLEKVPTKAITMGISTIMKTKEILLLISGESKKEALYRLLTGNVNESFPASVLKIHPYVTIIADKAAIADVKVQN